MKKISAKRLLNFTPDDFNTRLSSNITVVYDDGVEVNHSAHELTVNRYVFTLLELVPDIGIQSRYSIHNYYVGGQYVASTINKAFEAILEDVVNVYVTRNRNRDCLEAVYEKMYLIIEDIYNNVIYNHLEYVSSLNIRDFLDIQMKPELLAAIDEVRTLKSLDSVKNTYDVLDKVIRTSPDLGNNPIAKGYISGTISANQVKQLLASRGFVTEIDSSIFKYPIASSFVLGMDSIYDLAIESRAGAKALYLSNRAIQLSEYFAREMQLTTMGVERLVDGDCGNTDYIEWMVAEKDFVCLLGKHYFEYGKELIVNKDDTSIIGKTINIRSVARCKLDAPRHVCTSCFGKISNNVPIHSNLGHISLTVLTAIISQLILSTKHIITSASSDSIVLTDAMRDFFIVKNKDSYAFRANTINKKRVKYKLHISQEDGFGIADIHNSADVNKLNLARISKLDLIYLSMEDVNGNITELPLHVRQGNRYGNLTYAFLAYIKQYGHGLDSQDRFVIDLDNWSTGVPLISLPQIEFSYIDLAKAVKDEFKYMATDAGTPEAFLHKIFNLVNSKLSINLALLEVVVYGFTVRDPVNAEYHLGRNSDTAGPTKMSNIMGMRSVGGSLAWEGTMKILRSPSSYYSENDIDHPLDVMLMPNEVLLEQYGKL